MTTERETETRNGEGEPLSLVFRKMEFERIKSIVSCALEFRSKTSQSVRSAFASAISRSVRLDGFKDASRAQPRQLLEPVMFEILIEGNNRLAGAVIRAWAESQGELHDLVVERLGGLGVSAEYPDFKEDRFTSTWPVDEWSNLCEAVVEGRDDLDDDEAALMVCYVSGRIPETLHGDEREPEPESPMLLEWLDELRGLPPDAPEWADAPAFVKSVVEIATEKAFALVSIQIDYLEEAVTEIKREFGDELHYLELDMGSWFEEAVDRPDIIPEAVERVSALRYKLVEYIMVRPQAASRSEEARRADERKECEAAILNIAAEWRQMIDNAEPLGDGPPPDAEETEDVGAPTAETDAEADGAESNQMIPVQEYDALRSQMDRVREEGDSLRSENDRLKQENAGLLSDKTLLDEENSGLRRELSQRRETEESWRRVYVAAMASQSNNAADEPAQMLSVNDALAQAQRAFPDQLLFSLNSKSAKNSPFQKPDEVFEALAWLATEYHSLRTNPGASPDFDMLLKEACPGWSYKPGQAEVTKEQFAEWYTTTVGGKTYEMYHHIGKGISADPRNTVRIAFAWDDDLGKVVVGYVGLHQRTRRS